MNKKHDDEELQAFVFEAHKKIDKQVFDDDMEYYTMIKKALETEPEFHLPHDFARKTTLKAVKKKNIYDLYRSSTLYAGVSLVLAVVCSLAFYFLAKEVFFSLLSEIMDHKYPIIFSLIIIALVQLFDELFVRKKIKLNN